MALIRINFSKNKLLQLTKLCKVNVTTWARALQVHRPKVFKKESSRLNDPIAWITRIQTSIKRTNKRKKSHLSFRNKIPASKYNPSSAGSAHAEKIKLRARATAAGKYKKKSFSLSRQESLYKLTRIKTRHA